jgi:hypothetical protein
MNDFDLTARHGSEQERDCGSPTVAAQVKEKVALGFLEVTEKW